MGGAAKLTCSFCGKDEDMVRKLISGASAYICDECLDMCNEIVATEDGKVYPTERGVPERIAPVSLDEVSDSTL